MTTKLQIYCEAFMEASWLAAAVTLPLFFNISSAQTFEPDKMFLLRLIAALSGAAWLAKRVPGFRTGLEAPAKEKLKRFLPAHPVAVLVLCLAAVYALSAIFSIAPLISWLGSYTRAQGAVAFFCYAILFGVVVSELRTQAQIKRLIFAIIIASLPVSLYSILQHLGADPLRWRNPMAGRPSASMGNPIFLGAYLAMAIPMTFARFVDAVRITRRPAREEGRNPGLVLLICCGSILVLQVVALIGTQSRGPVIGLAVAVYICVFMKLILGRDLGKKPFGAWAGACVLGFLAPAAPVAAVRLASRFPSVAASACILTALAAVAAVYFFLWRARRSRSVLWLAWLAQTLTLLCFFSIGPSRIFGESVRVFDALGRLMRFSDESVSARVFLWESGLKAMRSEAPEALHGDPHDRSLFLRRAIGYGPECVWFAANEYMPSGLVKIHTVETVDRMHSEVFDNLISIGVIGAIASLALVAMAVFCAFRYLGFFCEGRHKTLFWALVAAACAGGVALPAAAGSPELCGVGIQAGLLAGVFGFAAWSGFQGASRSLRADHQTLVLCVIAALLAHFVETGVGIAVTPTRLHFYILLAVLCVLTAGALKREEEPAQRRASRAPRPRRNPLMPWTAIASFVLLAEAWCFVINTGDERSALSIFFRTWSAKPANQEFPLPGALVLLTLTLCGIAGLIYAEAAHLRALKTDFRKTTWAPVLYMAAVWSGTGLLTSYLWTATDAASPIDMCLRAETRITFFMAVFLFLWIGASLVLATADASRYAAAPAGKRGMWPCILLAACACAAIWALSLRPAWADIARRMARMHEDMGLISASIPLHERAVGFAPGVASHRMALGAAQLRAFRSESDPARRQSYLAAAEISYQQALKINPLDPAGQRAVGSFYMQTGEILADSASRDARIQRALPFLQQTVLLAPGYPDGYAQLGRCHFLLGDHAKAAALYEKALQINRRFPKTHMFIGEMHYRRNDLDRALQSFSEASQLSPGSIEPMKNVGMVLTRLGRRQEAVNVYLEALKRAPQDYQLLRRLATLYFGLGDYGTGIGYARRAYESRPPAAKGSFDDFLQELQPQTKQ